ncbi:unnamed protein product, partial [Vitis vinifera]
MININSRDCPIFGAKEGVCISVLRAYLDFGLEEGFYSVWNGVTSVLRWLLDFCSHDDNTVDDKAIITL